MLIGLTFLTTKEMTMAQITPTTEVNIWNFEGNTVPVKLLVLMAWKSALKAEVKGYQVTPTPVMPIVRKFLGCPYSYPDEMISQHIADSYDSVKDQLTH